MPVVVATFYKFVSLKDGATLQKSLQSLCDSIDLRGSILLANEGINATVAGSEAAITQLLNWLRLDPRFSDLTVKTAAAPAPPFGQMKVKLKREIVTFGQPEADPTQSVGTYVPPQDWNAVISDPDVVVVDTRNQYEVNIGTFKGAVSPQTDSFQEFPSYVETHLDPTHHKKIAMFCTGGIRCEKATAYLLSKGFEAVYHLQGGILKYLEEVPETESLWEGECFVFDERVAVVHGLQSGSYDLCHGCGHPISAADKQSPAYEACVSCPHCYGALTPEKRAKQLMRKQQRQQQRQHPS